MTEHKFHQQRERLLFRYTSALEVGDFATIETVLQIAQNDPSLGQMIEQINAAYAEEAVPAHFNGHHNSEAFPVDSRFHQQPQLSKSESPTVQPILMRSSRRVTTPSWLTLAAACFSVAAFVLLIVGTMLPESENALTQTIFDRLRPITAANAGQLQPIAQVGSGSVTAFAISTDGQTLAVGTSLGIWLHDALAPDAPRRKLNDTFVDNLTFSPDDTRLTAVLDGEILIWDAETGELVNTYGIDSNNAYRPPMFFAPDGQSLYAASEEIGECASTSTLFCDENFIYRINLDSGEKMVIEHKPAPLQLLAISPNGDRLAAFYRRGFDIIINDLTAPVRTVPVATLTRHSSANISAAFTPDSKYLAVSSGAAQIVSLSLNQNNLNVWDIATEEIIASTRVITPISPTLVGMSEDGSTIYYVDRDVPNQAPPEFIAWEYQTETQTSYPLPDGLSWGGDFAMNTETRLLVNDEGIRGLMRWTLTQANNEAESTWKALPLIDDYVGYVTQMIFMREIKNLVTASYATFNVWDYAADPVTQITKTISGKTPFGTLLARNDDDLLAYTSYGEPSISYWDSSGEHTQVNDPVEASFFRSMFAMDFESDDTIKALVIAGGNTPKTQIVGAGTLKVGEADGNLDSFVEFDLPIEPQRIINARHTGDVLGAISTESGLAALGGCLDKGLLLGLQRCETDEALALMLFDLNTGDLLYEFESQMYLTVYYEPLRLTLFTNPSSGQTWLAVNGCNQPRTGDDRNCEEGGSLVVWDVTATKDGQPPVLLHQFQTPHGVAGSVDFSSDGQLLAHVGRFGDLQVFDMTSGETLFNLQSENHKHFTSISLTFNDDNTLLAVGNMGYATLWGIPTE